MSPTDKASLSEGATPRGLSLKSAVATVSAASSSESSTAVLEVGSSPCVPGRQHTINPSARSSRRLCWWQRVRIAPSVAALSPSPPSRDTIRRTALSVAAASFKGVRIMEHSVSGLAATAVLEPAAATAASASCGGAIARAELRYHLGRAAPLSPPGNPGIATAPSVAPSPSTPASASPPDRSTLLACEEAPP